jgi:L-iditol 2-dehydrogenase
MKKILLSNKRAEIVSAPDPEPPDGWVSVAHKAVPICGSDKWAYNSEQPCDSGGHEGAGVVVKSRSPRLKPGDRVVMWPLTSCGDCRVCRAGFHIMCTNRPQPMQGSFVEQIIKPAHNCQKLPDDISFEIGSMSCCALGPAFGAARKLNITPSDTVLITGLGPVGLGSTVVASYFGAKVIAVEGMPWRRERALQMGASIVLDPAQGNVLEKIREITRGVGVDKAIDCSGNSQAERLCIDAAAIMGSVAFIGENHTDVPIKPSNDFLRKGLTLVGVWHYNIADYDLMLEMLRRSPHVPRLVSHTFPFEKADEAFKTFFQSGTAAKVVLTLE